MNHIFMKMDFIKEEREDVGYEEACRTKIEDAKEESGWCAVFIFINDDC